MEDSFETGAEAAMPQQGHLSYFQAIFQQNKGLIQGAGQDKEKAKKGEDGGSTMYLKSIG